MSQSYTWPSSSATANASVGTNGATAPLSSTEIGYINGSGNLTGVSTANPLPTTVSSSVLPTGAATSANQTTQITALQAIQANQTNGTQTTVVSSSALPTGASTSAAQATQTTALQAIQANQTNGTQVTTISGTVPLPTGAATSANQTTQITALQAIQANQTNGTQTTVVSSSVLPTGAATSANQTTEIGYLSSIASQTALPQPNLSIIGANGAGTIGNNLLLATAGTAAVDTTGYASGSVQITSTGVVGAWIFEGSDDNVTFWALQVFNQALMNAAAINTTITSTTGTIAYRFPIAARYLRLRVTTTSTGTVQAATTLNQACYAAAQMAVVATQGSPNTLSNGWPVIITNGTNQATVAASSTAVGTGAASLAVGLSPNSPVPAGTNTIGSVKITDGTNVPGVAPASTAPIATQPALVVSISPNSPATATTSAGSAGVANAPIYNVYSTTNVLTSAYVQLIASTTAATNYVDIFDSSGQGMILATGGAGSEVILYYVPPGGDQIKIKIPASTRVAYKALTANATSGYLLMNLLQ